MTSRVVKSLVKDYNNKIIPLCKILNTKCIPFPKRPLKTDHEVNEYHDELQKFMNAPRVVTMTGYDLIYEYPDKFPELNIIKKNSIY